MGLWHSKDVMKRVKKLPWGRRRVMKPEPEIPIELKAFFIAVRLGFQPKL